MRNEWYQKNGRKTGTVDLNQLFILSYFFIIYLFINLFNLGFLLQKKDPRKQLNWKHYCVTEKGTWVAIFFFFFNFIMHIKAEYYLILNAF